MRFKHVPAKPDRSRHGADRVSPSPHAIGHDRRRLATALGFSLLIHALLLSLTFGADELGLPGLDFPGAIDGRR